MKRFAFDLKPGDNFVKLEEPLTTHSNGKMILRNVDVYWDFINVNQNTVVNYGTDITFSTGYWDFKSLQKKFKDNDVTLTLNSHDSTCTVFGEDHPVKLGNLGPLLGFPLATTVSANTATTSPKKININQDVRFLKISCNLVKIASNYFNGKRSQIIACIPVTTNQKLSGSVSHFSDRYCQIPLYNGTFTEIYFHVNGSANILMEVEIF